MRPLVVVGPTGAGKSAIALAVAERFGAALVSMDAMQVYRGMDIGTAKPSLDERARVRHVCVDVREPDQDYSVAEFLAAARQVEGEGTPVVVCGGTTFWLRAFLDGLVPAPPGDPALRAALEALPDPWQRLAEVDPVLAARLHPNDRVRVVRGLEVHALTGVALSAHHAAHVRTRRDVELVWVDRDDLGQRIAARTAEMMDAGYLEEVRGLLGRGYHRGLKSMQSLGYAHLAAHLEGELTLSAALEGTVTATRQLARKQRGFLRGQGFSPLAGVQAAEAAWRAAERAFSPG